MYPHLGKRGAEGGGKLSPWDRRWTKRGRCRIWREGDASAEGPGEFRASAAGGDASPERTEDAHAGSPAASDASCTSQRELGKNLGGFEQALSKT